MAKYKIDWSIEAKMDLIDILEFYVKQKWNKIIQHQAKYKNK